MVGSGGFLAVEAGGSALDIVQRPGGSSKVIVDGATDAAKVTGSNASGGLTLSAAKAGNFVLYEGSKMSVASGEANFTTIWKSERQIIGSKGLGNFIGIRIRRLDGGEGRRVGQLGGGQFERRFAHVLGRPGGSRHRPPVRAADRGAGRGGRIDCELRRDNPDAWEFA
jgi:hypothetical protein